MRVYASFTGRCCLIFLRDRGALLLSMLSMFMVLLLMGVFLGDMNVNEITDLLNTYGGPRDQAADLQNARVLVHYWTLAGITVINAVMASLTIISTMINDRAENRSASFHCAPVNKKIVALSYITASVIMGMAMCIIVFLLYMLYICIIGGTMLSIKSMAMAVLYIFICVCIFSLIMYLAALFVKSASAWSAIGTITGTLAGFAGAIYIPMGSLAAGMASALKALPVLHAASLLRQVCCEDALDTLFEGLPAEVLVEYREYMGITVAVGDKALPPWVQALFISAFGLLSFFIIAVVSKRRNTADR